MARSVQGCFERFLVKIRPYGLTTWKLAGGGGGVTTVPSELVAILPELSALRILKWLVAPVDNPAMVRLCDVTNAVFVTDVP
jgi:hypothetical protein